MQIKQIIIGTRASQLALWQANHVKALIENNFKISVIIKKISTKGDQIQDRSLMDIGGKGLFLKEIEDELLAGTVDIAVHSMKDVPYELPAGLELAAILEREESSDAFVSNKFSSVKELPAGARVGTSSLRRMVQLRARYPQCEYLALRGNVDTRLKKLDQGDYEAIILATAGLKRLGWADRITQKLDLVSSVGQGAVGIECALKNTALFDLIAKLNHSQTSMAVRLERHFSKKLEATCQTPVGCHVVFNPQDAQKFILKHFRAEPDGTGVISGTVEGVWADGERLVDEI